jgi:hypothetical protein
MHEIHNTNRFSPRTFMAADQQVTLAPGEKKKFPVGSLSAGLMRVISHAKSDLKLDHLTEEAKKLAAKVLAFAKKPRGFAIVHGAGDVSVAEQLRREALRRQPPQVEDEFGKAREAAAKSQKNLQDPGEPLEPPREPDEDTGGQQEQEQTGEQTGEGKVPRIKLQPEGTGDATNTVDKTAIGVLLAEVESESINMKDLRARAKAILGDDYPPGNVGKEAIVEALTTAAKKA